ncbi:hypothetical protein TRFO_38200 [Tritrichomonas foetus]|uniref:Tubby C-terminal domain-containing protein n=1 Tax=Tritrichomonas foetus TaxID=1144522 RepID=A0A1J4JBP3_9EUKA|nr:hypothetical protein TRFO_38200 [Tritrichomonas foetus]|eukprot:OHS95663.1 hypothetical protein TRFO_38200 [Tritrichomonas foetus]
MISSQSFPIIFNNHKFYVDPERMSESSHKFQQLVQSVIENREQYYMKLISSDFTVESLDIFFKLCMKEPINVPTEMVEDILQISDFFKADFLKESALKHIYQNINSNYIFIPSHSHTNLELEKINNIHCIDNFDDFDFDEESTKLNDNNQKVYHSLPKVVIYELNIVKKPLRATTFSLKKEGKVIYRAKSNHSFIFIEDGSHEIRMSNSENLKIKINRKVENINEVVMNDSKFFINYITFPQSNISSMDVIFEQNGQQYRWRPMEPKYNNKTNKFTLSLGGEYRAKSVVSKHNMTLINSQGKIVFICRKVANGKFEIETSSLLNSDIAAALAFSAVVGPLVKKNII